MTSQKLRPQLVVKNSKYLLGAIIYEAFDKELEFLEVDELKFFYFEVFDLLFFFTLPGQQMGQGPVPVYV